MSPATLQPARQFSSRTVAEAQYRAVVAAGRAPSAYNAQPWRWRLGRDFLDLFLDRARMLDVSDPHGHLALLGCGAALHHARLALAARGWRVTVSRCPAGANPRHLARLRIDEPAAVSPGTARLARAVRLRHTDPRPVTGDPIEASALRTISAAFRSHDIRLHVLRPDQVLALTVATAHTGEVAPAQAQWHSELALWTGDGRIAGAAGGPRRPGPHGEHDRAATFAVLHGGGDSDLDWLYAGEALSAGWLVATQFGVSVLPFSATVERAGAQEMLDRAVPELSHPYLMLRLGRHATGAVAPHTRRLPAAGIIEREDG